MSTRIVCQGPGFLSLLTIVFVVAKLCDKITWSWLWVFCPIWISLIAFILFLIVFAILLAIVHIKENK